MITRSAQLAAGSDEDRVTTTDNSVIVLDGATAHDPTRPQAGKYVDELGKQLRQRVPNSYDLRAAVAQSISATSEQLHLIPGSSPSSTVAIVRVTADTVDLLVLGDSAVIVGTVDGNEHVLIDDRLARIDLPESRIYRDRLSTGAGYDDEHGVLLQELQRAEGRQRNQPGGFWIAEADPIAATHALTSSYDRTQVAWAVAATDGAFDLLPSLGISWHTVADMTGPELHELLRRCHAWEAETDPEGQALPRAKRHDDKSVVVIHP